MKKKAGVVDAPWHPGSRTTKWDDCADEYTLNTKAELLERAMSGGTPFKPQDRPLDEPQAKDYKELDLDVHNMTKDEVRELVKHG